MGPFPWACPAEEQADQLCPVHVRKDDLSTRKWGALPVTSKNSLGLFGNGQRKLVRAGTCAGTRPLGEPRVGISRNPGKTSISETAIVLPSAFATAPSNCLALR